MAKKSCRNPLLHLFTLFYCLFLQFLVIPSSLHAENIMPISGAGDVIGNTGAFAYSIPIVTPPGNHGFVPTLTLNYNSRKENGVFGVGWDIPIGNIARNAKFGVNYNCTPSTSSPACYVYNFGGSSGDLIPRSDLCASNCYGAMIENTFMQFNYIPDSVNGDHWQVLDKKGTKYTFGTTAASRQDGPLGTFKWMMDSTVDPHTNVINYAYVKDQGEIYISQIDYQTNHIQFSRDTGNRSDKPVSYLPNFPVTTAYRFSSIDVYSNCVLTTSL